MRKPILEKRRALSENQKALSDKLICSKLEKLLLDEFKEKEHFLCYYPLKDEINLIPLYEKMLENGKKLYFPKTFGTDMEFYKVFSLEEFERGSFNVMEPVICDEERIFTGLEAVGIIPGAVFDTELNRIGYGKGYYDRYLGKKPQIVKIAACYKFQLVNKIEAKPWDVKMDFLVTD
ncbi:MAG: 5-formyltetrahydrofolate cyclo-ligase [Lachnospiraceae bacterium]|nr:5-formyltetrahydrofolate cyclo-ligase [Lachnospiraceae bacterium]